MTRFALAACILGITVAAACGDATDDPVTAGGDGSLRTVEINGAQLFSDGRSIANLNVCNADENTAQVSESDREVRVTARTDGPVAGEECSDGIQVSLDAPLGDRALVDATTGNEVRVDRHAG